MNDLKKQSTEKGQEESFIEKLVSIDKNLAISVATDTLIAGVANIANGAVMALYCLAKNEDKQDRLREELKKVVLGENDALTSDMLENLPYLRAVIKETFRLHPLTAVISRKVSEDVVISGFQIHKGTDVVLATSMSNEDSKQFSEPQKFIPERWLKAGNAGSCPQAKSSNPFAYLPFGFGLRMCVGKRFAQLEIEVLVTEIIRNHKIEWHHSDLKTKTFHTKIPIGEVKFRVTDLA